MEKTLMVESRSVLYAALVRNKDKEDDHSKVWREGCLSRILDSIAKEIHCQELLDRCETMPEVLTQAVDYVELPPEGILDKVQRYFTANARARFRMLQELEIGRRLKPKPRSGRRTA
jgi:hypothetical protein